MSNSSEVKTVGKVKIRKRTLVINQDVGAHPDELAKIPYWSEDKKNGAFYFLYRMADGSLTLTNPFGTDLKAGGRKVYLKEEGNKFVPYVRDKSNNLEPLI